MPTTFRVTDAWSRPEASNVRVTLDYEGAAEGLMDVVATPAVFALIQTMMTHGKPVYHDTKGKRLSTDPSFGGHAHNEAITSRASIVDTDLLWNFGTNKGLLIMILQNRDRAHLAIDDPALLAGWALTIRDHTVTFDGAMLQSLQDTGIPIP